ncbi:NAD-dependent protein deacetylase [Acidisoma sp. 7E03]
MTSPADLEEFIARSRRLFVLTGAGCSTPSGIPDYRDREGNWKGAQPMTYQAFMGDPLKRQRYWARSMAGWPQVARAKPNRAHRALAALEAQGRCEVLLTQNVDGLHEAAGSQRVIDLHGRLDQVICTACGHRLRRAALQRALTELNPDWAEVEAAQAPDGDAAVEVDSASFAVPPCPRCGGVLKPDVVFFGENVPLLRVERARTHLAQADAMLIVGSSLMVMSGFRFVLTAAEAGLPIAVVNLGRSRADDLAALKLEAPCEAALSFLLPDAPLPSVTRARPPR